MKLIIVEAEKVLAEFKHQIEKVFKDVVYFIYDPNCENYFADDELKLYFFDPEVMPKVFYPINEGNKFIRKDLNYKFLKQVQKTQT